MHATYELEYGSDTLEMHRDAVGGGARVIVLDDVLATGGTAKAKVDLVEQLGGIVVGALFLIELTFLHGRDKLAGVRRPRADRVLSPRNRRNFARPSNG